MKSATISLKELEHWKFDIAEYAKVRGIRALAEELLKYMDEKVSFSENSQDSVLSIDVLRK